MNLAAAVPLSLLASVFFSISSVLQQHVARRAPESESLSLRLLLDLIRKPVWVAGILFAVAAFVCQAVALAFGPVAVVEPLICLELVFALPLATWMRRRQEGRDGQLPRHLGPREWLGAGCVAGGVAAFLASSAPSGGRPEPSLVTWGEVALPALLVATSGLVLARGPETPRRAMILAGSAGICFSLLALVTQSFVTLISARGLGAALGSWQPYVLLCLGATGFTIAQSAFQSAPLAVSLPVIDSVEPTVAVVLAGFAFGQRLDTAATAVAIEAGGAMLAVAGIWLLGRSPLVLSIYEQQQARKERAWRPTISPVGAERSH